MKRLRGSITGQRKVSIAVAGQTQQVTVVQTNAEQSQQDEESSPVQSDGAVSSTSETPGSGGKTAERWNDYLSFPHANEADDWCVRVVLKH